MKYFCFFLSCFLLAYQECLGALRGPGEAKVIALVTGATGRTGSLVFNELRKHEDTVEVRGLVRDRQKARERLDCGECEEADGIFEGDVTDPSSLQKAFVGVHRLVILTSAVPIPKEGKEGEWTYEEGGFPIDIDFNGVENQLTALTRYGGQHGVGGRGSPSPSPMQVVLVSSMGTTEPNSKLDLLGNGHALFYKTQGEAAVMSTGFPFTIVKPCALSNAPGRKMRLETGRHDGTKWSPPLISREDVGRVVSASVLSDVVAKEKRLWFDLCSVEGTPQEESELESFLISAEWGADSKRRRGERDTHPNTYTYTYS